MATEKIIVEYIAEVDGLKAELKTVQKEMHNTEKAGVDAGKKTADAFAKTEEKTVSLKTQLKNLKAQLANATDPKEVERLAKAVGALADQLEDASDQAKIFSSESKFEQMGNALGSVKDKLMNLDFKGAADQSKLLVSVVKSFSVADVISGIKDMGTALLNVGKALLGNPLFLLAGALVAIGYEAFQVGKAMYEMNTQTIVVTESIVAGNKAMLEYADRYAESQIKIRLALGLISDAQAKGLQLTIKNNKELRDKNTEYSEAIIELAKKTGVSILNLDEKFNATKNQKNGLSRIEENLANKKFNLEKIKLDKEFARQEIGLRKSQSAERLAEVTKNYTDLNKKTAEQVKKNNEDIKALREKDMQDLIEETIRLEKLLRDLQTQNIQDDYERKKQIILDQYADNEAKEKGHNDIIIEYAKLRDKQLEDLEKERWKKSVEQGKLIQDLKIKNEEDFIKKFKEGAKDMEAVDTKLSKTVIANQEKIIQAQKKRAEAEKQLLQNSLDYTKQISDLIFSAMKQSNQNKLDDLQQKGNEEIALLDSQLAKKEISQEIYNERKTQIEKKQKEEEKKIRLEQYKLEKQQAIINITISTAESIAKTLASVGLPAGIPLIAIASALGLAQIALVESQPTPKFEKGGEVGGKLHRDGGTIIEAERGEYIINRKHSKENKSLLEAINKGNGSKYIEDKFIAPMLKEQQKKFNQMKDNAFSDNLINSMILNSSNFKDSNLLDSMKRSRQADKENALLIINSLKSNYNSRKW